MKAAVYILLAVYSYCAVTANDDGKKIGVDEFYGESLNRLEEQDIQARLSGGKNASIAKYPFVASILINGKVLGGGTILNRRWLVIGAYVAFFVDKPSDMLVRVGSSSSFEGGFTSPAKRIVLHPEAQGYKHDFALVQVEHTLPHNKHIRPAKIGILPRHKGATVIFTSFGFSHYDKANKGTKHHHHVIGVLKETTFKYMPSKTCHNKYYFNLLAFTKYSFCTEMSNKTEPERGDFGSPLLFRNKVIGAFSGKTHDKPPVFMDLTRDKAWIYRTIKEYSQIE